MKFGNSVRTRKAEYWRDRKSVIVFHPMIEVDGKYVHITDVESASGVIECLTRSEAIAQGHRVLEGIRATP